MSANLGDSITKKKITERIYFQRKTDGEFEENWLDLGNCVAGGFKPDVQRAEHMKSEGGFKRTDLSLVKSIKPLISIELDEHTPDLERLRALSAAGEDATQAANPAIAAEELTDDSLKGRTYFTAKQGITSAGVVVKVGATVYVEDVDYVVELGSGAITILNDSTIPNASTVTVDYACAEVVTKTFTAFEELHTEGRFKLIETDQFSSVPRVTTTWEGNLYVANWGENTGDDFTKTTIESIPLNDPTVVVRAD